VLAKRVDVLWKGALTSSPLDRDNTVKRDRPGPVLRRERVLGLEAGSVFTTYLSAPLVHLLLPSIGLLLPPLPPLSPPSGMAA
jgi:hypothetical protein